MDLEDLFEGIGSTRPLSKGDQRVVRVLFGLLLALLCAVEAYHMATIKGGLALRLAMMVMFGTLGLFGLSGIAFGVGVKPLGCLFVLSFFSLFVVRILFGD